MLKPLPPYGDNKNQQHCDEQPARQTGFYNIHGCSPGYADPDEGSAWDRNGSFLASYASGGGYPVHRTFPVTVRIGKTAEPEFCTRPTLKSAPGNVISALTLGS